MSMGPMNHLRITVCQNADDAIERGYVYRQPEYRPAVIKEAVVVRDGTVEHNPTVDLIIEDEMGNKFVVMITGRLLKSLPL